MFLLKAESDKGREKPLLCSAFCLFESLGITASGYRINATKGKIIGIPIREYIQAKLQSVRK